MDPLILEDPIWFRHRFTQSIIFILGLIWSYMMVEKTFLDILITRLTNAWKAYDLRISVIVVSSHEAITILFEAAFSYATDVRRSRLGRYRMVVYSTAVCLAGLMLYVVTATDNKGQPNKWLYLYPAMGLLALAQAGHGVTLRVFLEDQFRRVEANEDERRRSTKFWWILIFVVAAIFAQLEPLTGFAFKTLAQALIIVMILFFLVFYFGFNQYYDGEIDDGNDGGPHQGIRWRVMILLFRLWVCLSNLSLVSASGSTFFLLEATALVARHDNLFSLLILANLVRVMEIIVSEVSKWGVTHLNQKLGYRITIMELIRIGLGIVFCILCCNIASMTAMNRMDDGGAMSVYWLIPQFFLLGLIRGFAKDGFQSVFESNVQPRYQIYGRCLGALTRGFGSSLSVLCVYIFGMKQFYIFGSKQFQWFQYDLDKSRLNYYYTFLAILSFCNGALHMDLMRPYIGTRFLLEDQDMHEE